MKGNEVVPCRFSEIKYDFYEKKFMVKEKKTDTNYIVYSDYTPDNLHQTTEQSKATVNTIQNRYKTDKIAYHFHSAANGYYSVKVNDKEGICDLNGRELMAPDKYNSVIYYKKDGYYNLMSGDKAGVCDLSGKVIITPDKYNTVYKSGDCYTVVKGDKMGLCDLKGKEIISPVKYNTVYKAGDYYMVKIGDKMGLCDLKGKEIISPVKYTDINTYCVKDGFYEVKRGDKMGLLDLTGKEIISPTKYTDISTYYVKDGYYQVKTGDKMGLLDLTGKEIITPDKYTEIATYTVKDGYYQVKTGNKMGLLDLTGKEIIPCKYDLIVLHGGYFGVELNEKKGACDLTGKEVIPCVYDEVLLLDSYYRVSLRGKLGARDLTGKELVPCEYQNLIYLQGEFKYENSSGNWVPVGSSDVLTEKSVSSDSGVTTSATSLPEFTEEYPLFFLNKNYVMQSSDYSKMHMVGFSGEEDFLYMVFDARTGSEIGRQYGDFTHQNGHIKIAFTDNSVSEFEIKMINQNKISLLFAGTTTPVIYAVALSSDDLFSANAAQYWGNQNNSQQSTYQPFQQPQQQYQQKVTQRVVCTSCSGTGKKCILKTVPTYGTHSNVKHRCTTCNELLGHGIVHVQQRCSACQGKGYIER